MSTGLQELMKTEQDAKQIVDEARKYRTNRLKSAKVDSQKEIDEYKKQKEDELKKYESEHAGLNESLEKEADSQVQQELETIREQFKEKKDAVVKLLIDAVNNPTLELHANAAK